MSCLLKCQIACCAVHNIKSVLPVATRLAGSIQLLVEASAELIIGFSCWIVLHCVCYRVLFWYLSHQHCDELSQMIRVVTVKLFSSDRKFIEVP